jgi:hypothetical protein
MEKINLIKRLTESVESGLDMHSAAILFLRKLSLDAGIYIKPSSLPQIFQFGEENDVNIHKMISRIIVPDYDCPDELVCGLRDGGVPISCNKYLDKSNLRQNLPTNFIDHDKTLALLRERGLLSATTPLKEAQQYLSHMRDFGVCFHNEPWEEQIPKEYAPLIKNPNHEIEFHAASGKDLTRCVTGWTKTSSHQGNPLYRLSSGWTNDAYLTKRIETYHHDQKFSFTDSICPACAESIEKEMLE